MAKKRRGAFIDITWDPRTLKQKRLIEQLPKRAEAMLRMVPWAVAQSVYEGVQRGIPNKREFREMRKQLRVAKIGGTKKGKSAAYTVHVPVKAKKVKKGDVQTTIVTIEARRKLVPRDKVIDIFVKLGPWTLDTLPFLPNEKDAVIIQKKASIENVEKLRKKQQAPAQKRKVKQAFEKAGKRVSSRERLKVAKRAKAIPQMGLQAVNEEFGADGKRANPVWRRELRRVSGPQIKKIVDLFPVIKKTWFDGNNKRYKITPPRSLPSIGRSAAKKNEAFQSKIR